MSNIKGKYGYTIQGFMHGQNIDNHKYLVNAVQSLELNLAEADLVPDPNSIDPNDHNPGRTRTPVPEMPLFTGYYSAHFPVLQTPPTLVQEPNPNPYKPFYAPTVGYYPFTEIGYMTFSDEAPPPGFQPGKGPYGGVKGWRRLNGSGYPGPGSTFMGRYKYDAVNAPGGHGFTGVITTQFDGKPNHVWDYTFTQISDDEIFIAANGRAPRPGVGTGTMRKIS